MADDPMEIIEKPVIRYEVVCKEHGPVDEFADRQDAENASRRHRRLFHDWAWPITPARPLVVNPSPRLDDKD